MEFNTLENLEAGKVELIYKITDEDIKILIKNIRNSTKRINIINGFLDKLKDKLPFFCFNVIYDKDEFYDEAKNLLDKYYNIQNLNEKIIEKLLNNSKLSFYFLEKYLDEIINKFPDNLNIIFKFLFSDVTRYYNLLKKISLHNNLHIRYLFMKYLIEKEPQRLNMFYDDITKYLTNETNQEFEQLCLFKDYMDMKEVCELAYIFLTSDIDYNIWKKFKEFILTNYQCNDLAYHLLSPQKINITESAYKFEKNKSGINEFNQDADILFLTSSNYHFQILTNYSEKVSKELLEQYKMRIKYFQKKWSY